MNKKYPKDTLVTLEMLVDIFDERLFPINVGKIKSMIEPPKPEPNDGEWWMCKFERDSLIFHVVLQRRGRSWRDNSFVATNNTEDEYITPLYKMVQEKEAE